MFANISVWSLVLNVVILLVSVGGFIKIMKNDLTHLQKDLTEVKGSVNHVFEKVTGLCERVSKIEGYHQAKKENKNRKTN